MVTVKTNNLQSIQSAITELEDMIKRMGNLTYQDVWMNVAATSPGIPHGAGVGMTANSTVDLSSVPRGFIGINNGAAGVAGGKIPVRGGADAQVFIKAGQTVVAGSPIYYNPAGDPDGQFSTAPGGLQIGMVYDVYQFVIGTGGLVKALVDIRGIVAP